MDADVSDETSLLKKDYQEKRGIFTGGNNFFGVDAVPVTINENEVLNNFPFSKFIYHDNQKKKF